MMIIYKTTNLVNGKIYVGKHNKDNDNYLGSGKILKQAIKKYGKKNVKRETLENVTEENWIEREIFHIEDNDARNFEVGYNLSEGGKGAGSDKNNPMYGRKHTEESKRKISDSLSGEKSVWFGRRHTEQTLAKMRLAAKNKVPLTCPHCGKKAKDNVVYRWHFDNCKMLKSKRRKK